jgi:heme/copper-type cytochrome/quinol oxidase subunit 3
MGNTSISHRRAKTPASIPPIRRGDALDVSVLPSYGFSHRSLMWWGNAGMMTIEGVAFGFMIVIYFYLRTRTDTWPVGGTPPDLKWGTVNLVIILLSAIPNWYAGRGAVGRDTAKVRVGLIGSCILQAGLCAVRWMEFTALNVRWDEGAYGSAVWVLLGLHTFNLVTDFGDTLVLTAVMYTKPLEGKRFADIAENCGYWYFIVLTWIPIYAVIYFGARV